MFNIEIDGQQVEVEQGQMIIEAADAAGIAIPRFCYHKKLSIAANCRMCLVEVEKARKPMPACATPVTEGMRVFTKTPAAIHSQRTVMEFLLINHPLDCPICDQGGQCELQDISMSYGEGVSEYTQGKRSVDGDDLGSLVATDMTRCIHCTRCIRFCEEVAGIKELGATNRGEHMEVGTYVDHALESEVSGNIIDLCPVGALTSKPFRYQARAWELQQMPSVASHDCVGANTFVHTRRQEVMRVVPRECEDVNEVWLSDRDRFSYTGLESEERLAKPLVKQDGQWQEATWADALNAVKEGLQRVKDKHGASQIAALSHPSSTTEEHYLLQKLMRGIGCHNLDHRLNRVDFSDQDQFGLYPRIGTPVAKIDELNAILLVGSNIRHEQPSIGLRVRKAALSGAHVMMVNPMAYEFHMPMSESVVVKPSEMVSALAQVAKAASELASGEVPAAAAKLLSGVSYSEAHKTIAKKLADAEQATIMMGALAQNHAHAANIRALCNLIAEFTGSSCGALTEGANAQGAWLVGMLPHRAMAGADAMVPGLDAQTCFAEKLRAYVLHGIEPEADVANSQVALDALKQADFVVSTTVFVTDAMKEYADVILPVAPATETSGTFINVEGRWQGFRGARPAFEEGRPAWKVFRVLGNLFALEGFDFESSEQVLTEVHAKVKQLEGKVHAWVAPERLPASHEKGLEVIAERALYQTDAIVRRAAPLASSKANPEFGVHVSVQTAQSAGVESCEQVEVKAGEHRVSLPLVLDERVPTGAVWLPSGYAESAVLTSHATVTLAKG